MPVGLRGIFFTTNWCKRGQSTTNSTILGQVGLGCLKKKVAEQASQQHFSAASVSGPPSRSCLPWLLAMMDYKPVNQKNPSFPYLIFDRSVHHSNRSQIRTFGFTFMQNTFFFSTQYHSSQYFFTNNPTSIDWRIGLADTTFLFATKIIYLNFLTVENDGLPIFSMTCGVRNCYLLYNFLTTHFLGLPFFLSISYCLFSLRWNNWKQLEIICILFLKYVYSVLSFKYSLFPKANRRYHNFAC